MPATRLAILILFLCAASAFAQLPVAIDPPDPTSTDPVTLIVQQYDSCPPAPEVVRSGFNISVVIRYGLCLSPPGLITHRVELGVLPAGQYTVTVTDQGHTTSSTFTVRDANGSVRVAQSTGSTQGGSLVTVTVEASHCIGRDPKSCPAPVITFGGVPATDVVTIDGSRFTARTPAHAAGPVEVRVAGDSFTVSSYAFRYFDPAAAPSTKFFEKVLVPIIYNGPGALGSSWVTELSMKNTNDFAVEPWQTFGGMQSIAVEKPIRFTIPDSSSGRLLVLPRSAASAVSFHAVVRDTSRSSSDWGTELPIVRESEFTRRVQLLDIPTDTRFRTMLRVYSLDRFAGYAWVQIFSMDDRWKLAPIPLQLVVSGPCSTADCADQPAFAAMVDLSQRVPDAGGRIGLDIYTVGSPIWAFATMTNNETQHVTMFTPQ